MVFDDVVNQEHVFGPVAQANNTKMRDWCERNRIEPIKIGSKDNNCLIRCLVAANSANGKTVDEDLVSEIANSVRENSNTDMLMLGDEVATKALGIINDKRRSQKLPPFYLLEIQPAEKGPQIIQYGDDKDGVPLPVLLTNNHFELLVLSESRDSSSEGAIALRKKELSKEIIKLQSIGNIEDGERKIYEDALAQKQKEVSVLRQSRRL